MSKRSKKTPDELIPILEEQVRNLLERIAILKREQAHTAPSVAMAGLAPGCYTIEADGGTSKNDPRDYGIGYGSFKIGDGEVQQDNFSKTTSARGTRTTPQKSASLFPRSGRSPGN